VSETKAGPARNSVFGAALAGGIIGALVAAALLLFAAPSLIGSRIVRQGLLADPKILSDAVDALRDAQYAPVLATIRAALETPFASSWKGAAKPEVTLVEFFDYACPYCKASNPAVEQLLREDKGLREEKSGIEKLLSIRSTFAAVIISEESTKLPDFNCSAKVLRIAAICFELPSTQAPRQPLAKR